MKKGIFSVTGCALALGLIAAPAANASTVQPKEKISFKQTASSASLAAIDVKNISKKAPVSEDRDHTESLDHINQYIDNTDTTFQEIVPKVDEFYTNYATARKELAFYNTTLKKLKAHSNQLASYKNQLDHISKQYGHKVYLNPFYNEISNLQESVIYETKKLNHIHANFVPMTPTDNNNQV
jgi:DNA repair ATPase RecN